MIGSEIVNNTSTGGDGGGSEVINEQEMVNEFQELFQAGRAFASRAILRSEVTRYGQKYNVVMSTKNSNYRSVHLWCKHAGSYKQGKRKSKAPDRVIKPRNKMTKRTGCGCYIKAKLINEMWTIEHSHGEHNHTIPNSRTVYSIHRRQSEEIKSLILQLLNDGQKISNILEYLHMIGINNIIKKDIENLQQQFRRKEKLKIKNEVATTNNNNNTTTTVTTATTIAASVPNDFVDPLLYHSTIPIIHYTNTESLNTPSSILNDTAVTSTSLNEMNNN